MHALHALCMPPLTAGRMRRITCLRNRASDIHNLTMGELLAGDQVCCAAELAADLAEKLMGKSAEKQVMSHEAPNRTGTTPQASRCCLCLAPTRLPSCQRCTCGKPGAWTGELSACRACIATASACAAALPRGGGLCVHCCT